MLRLGPKSGFGSTLCGNFRESVQPLDEGAEGALEAFVNLEPNIDEPEIETFTDKYGLLRWNWTHEGQGGSKSDQFEMPIPGFKESHEQLQVKWLASARRSERKEVISWLSKQLGKDSAVDYVETVEEMWKLSQPRMNLGINLGHDDGLEINLVLGDLWQAMCCQMLDILREHGAFLCCGNDKCKNKKFFVKRGKESKYCSRRCGKQVADRHSKRRRDAAKKRAAKVLLKKSR
jgi:hypothetical protein